MTSSPICCSSDTLRLSNDNPQPGDYFVVRTKGIFARIIRWVTRSDFNHAGVLLYRRLDTGSWVTVEASMKGAHYGNLDIYATDWIEFSQECPTNVQRERIVAEAILLVNQRIPYGIADLDWLALLQWGIRFSFIKRWVNKTDDLVCSQLVALCYQEAGIVLSQCTDCSQDVTPGDLARRIQQKAGCGWTL